VKLRFEYLAVPTAQLAGSRMIRPAIGSQGAIARMSGPAVVRPQISAVPSSLPDASVLPFGAMASEFTRAACPVNRRRSWPVARSHNVTKWSSPAETSVLPLGKKAITPSWPSRTGRRANCDAASSDNFVPHVVHSRRYPEAEESGPWALVLEFSTIDRDNQRVWMRRGGEAMERFSPQDERA
jgi:hypothetical protein